MGEALSDKYCRRSFGACIEDLLELARTIFNGLDCGSIDGLGWVDCLSNSMAQGLP